MTNKEFQNILKLYGDDLPIYVDNTFGWNVPSNKNYVDPEAALQTDESGYPWGIELRPNEFPEMDIATIRKIIDVIIREGIVIDKGCTINDNTLIKIKKCFDNIYM